MSAALALAFVVGSGGTVAAAPQQPDVAKLVRDACVETGLERPAFERLAGQRRWRRARITSDTGPAGGWTVAYRADGAGVMLSQVPGFGPQDPSLGSVCTISVERAGGALEDDIAALAGSLGLAVEAPIADIPGSVPIRTWSVLAGWTLTYAAAPDGRAAISLSRQFIVEGPPPTSPDGDR